MQSCYNLLYREEEREMNRFCDETGVGLIPWGPLAHGTLARPTDADSTTRSSKSAHLLPGQTDADKEIIARVEAIAKEKGWSMGQVALAWVQARVASPIIGFSSVERIEEAIEAATKELTEEEEKRLEEPYVPKPVMGFDTSRPKLKRN